MENFRVSKIIATPLKRLTTYFDFYNFLTSNTTLSNNPPVFPAIVLRQFLIDHH